MRDPGVLPIVECGDPVLRRPAEPVRPAELRTRKLRQLIAAMRATMEAAPGVGLAAPQVGVPIQLAVLQGGQRSGLDPAAAAAGQISSG